MPVRPAPDSRQPGWARPAFVARSDTRFASLPQAKNQLASLCKPPPILHRGRTNRPSTCSGACCGAICAGWLLQTRSDDLFLRIGGVKTRADRPSGCIDASWRPICAGPLQVEGRSGLFGASWAAIWALLRKSDPARASDMPSVAIRVQPRYGQTLDARPHTGARLGSQRALLLVQD